MQGAGEECGLMMWWWFDDVVVVLGSGEARRQALLLFCQRQVAPTPSQLAAKHECEERAG